MTKRASSRNIIIALCILAIGALTMGLLNIKNQPSNSASMVEAASDDLVVTAQLVDTRVTYTNSEYSNAVGSSQTTIATINNGDTVVLENADAYDVAVNGGTWSQDDQSGITTQAIRFAMGTLDSSVQLSHLSISATLNGEPLVISETGTDNSFEQYFFGMPNELYISDINGNSVASSESCGRIIFSYTYRTSSSSGETSEALSGSFSFNLLTTPYLSETNNDNAWDYINLYRFVEVESTSSAELSSATREDENLYFNYNNFTYTSTGNDTGVLNMPIIRYDATKFNLSYTRRIYNSLETVTSTMEVSQSDGITSAKITFSSTLNGVTETFTYDITDIDTDPMVELIFEDIGEYEFTMSLLTRTSDTEFLPVANADAAILGAQPITKDMTIFGYQLKYADDSTNTAELRNEDYGLYADITNLNYSLFATRLVAKTSTSDTSTSINIGQLQFFADENGNILIPSTNQAPLWMDYLGTLNSVTTSQYFYYAKTSTMDYSKLGEYVPTESGQYVKGQYFMNAGLYILEINYTLSSIGYQNLSFKQYFAFEITNTSPSAQIIALGDNNSTLYNDGYTNKNVAIDWDTSNPFNAEIYATYDLYTFDNTLAVSGGNINKYGTDNQTTLTKSGKYYVRLYYGRLATSYTAWEFTIDKDDISGLTINFSDSYINPSISAIGVESLNTAFTLSWNAKRSGAQISLEHQQMLLMQDSSYVVNNIDNLVYIGEDSSGNKMYALKNGYQTSTLSSSITYSNIDEFSVSQYALHFFRLYDEAGNELYYAVLLDNTSPSFIFDPAIENDYNIIKDTTGVIWGNSKAISFSSPLTGQSTLFDYFLNYDLLPNIVDVDNGILNIAFDSIRVHHAQLQGELYQTSLTISSPAMQVVIDESAGTITAYTSQISVDLGTITFINSSSPLVASISTDLEEYFYSIDVCDSGTTATGSTNTGLSTTLLEVNLDASQVLAFSADDSSDYRLYNGSATNRDKVYVNYFAERDEFEVESLTLEFYPLAMDKSLETYPYLDSPTITQDLMSSATYDSDTGKMRTDYFNLVYDSSLQRTVTQAGKYVVTRTYVFNSTLFDSENDERRTKTYTFYVDRYNIIQDITVDYPITVNDQNVFTRTVGEYIMLALGIKDQQYAEFNDLLLSATNNNVILATDLLPINPVVPENKYSVLDNSTYSPISSYNLNLSIYYKATQASDTSYSEVVNVSANSLDGVIDQLLVIDSKQLMRVGIYRFTLTDNTGYSQIVNNVLTSNINPNTFTFRIQVEKTLPTGTYYGTPNADGSDKTIIATSSSSGTTVASSSDDELKFVFTETTNIYKAKINYVDVVVDRKVRGATSWETAVTIRFDDAEFDSEGNAIYPSSLDMTSLSEAYGIREPIASLDSAGNVLIDDDGNIIYQTDSAGDVIYKYSIFLPTKNRSGSYYEGEYRVTIHYYGDESYYLNDAGTVSYYTNTVNVVLDHTAPNFNLLRLVYADKYLPETSADSSVVSKQDIIEYAKNQLETNAEKKERVRQFLRSYAFALPSDFVFYKATNENFSVSMYDDYTYPEHDTGTIYVRKYNKFSTTDDDNQQSYINSDPEYSDVTQQRFEVANSLYKAISYGTYGVYKNSFYQTIAQETGYASGYGQEGYYEIIEIDQAGNQRIYTVYLKTTDTSAVFSDGTLSEVGDELHTSLSLGYDYTLTELQNLDCYTRINLYDRTTGDTLLQSFDVTPSTDISSIITAINEYTSEAQFYATTGAKFDIEFLNRFGDDYTISLQRPGEQLGYTITEGAINFSITLPTATNSTWLVDFVVRQYNATTKSLDTLNYDLNGSISNTEFSGVTYTFNSGEYYFYMIDNFGRGETQPVHYIFGIVDAHDLVFSGSEVDDVTASDVSFTYQTRLYTAEVYVNGVLISDFENYDNITVYDNETNYTRFLNFGAASNTSQTYRIVLNYNTGGLDVDTEPLTYLFTIDTILPNFELTDANGNNMNFLLNTSNSSTSKEVYISWNEPTNFPVTVTLKQNDGTAFEISKNYSIAIEGTYTLTMTNTLGNSVSYTFSISQNSAILYDVYANGQTIGAGLNSALFAYSGIYDDQSFDIYENVKVYVSIYELSVIANENKDLQAKLIFQYESSNVYNLKIYQIYGSSSLYYSEYIALLQLDSSILNISNFIIGETDITAAQVSGYSMNFYSQDVYASWQNSFSLEVLGFNTLSFSNFINVDIYYNSAYVSQFSTNTLHFTDSGEYRLYFSDIAGYSYRFTSGLLSRDYFTIDLLNSVSFTINDNEPINYAIFNDEVKLTITNTSRYDKGSFSMTASLNNQAIDVSDYYANGAYTFNEYGTYRIYMNAKYNGTSISSQYVFTILSNNEAQSRFSFNQYDSFEIISVIKEGVDITQDLKDAQGTSKLMTFDFSTKNNDIGHYAVTVRVTQSELKPVMNFAFEFWLNTAEINLMPSIPFGTSTTSKITIDLNMYAINQSLGNVVIKITGMDDIIINAETAASNELTTIELTENQTYNIQAYTESGRLLASYIITKDEPLNTIAIIIIVVSCIIVVALIVLFVVYRTRMKVR